MNFHQQTASCPASARAPADRLAQRWTQYEKSNSHIIQSSDFELQ
jgi:hypothetical protein